MLEELLLIFHLDIVVIETLEKTQMIVPNDIMNKAIIENISQIEHVKANYLYIDISYESDIDQAIKVIQDLVVNILIH